MVSMKKPNFFIIGAPKCGTTALSAYLNQHPNVFFCEPKEPHFFDLDFAIADRKITNLNQYLDYFQDAQDQHLAIGEGSTRYLRSEVAVSKILEFNPSAKFIIMVRNPVEIAQSLHSQLLYIGIENVADFERAWRLQDARRLGQHVPQLCDDPKRLMYGWACELGRQLESFYKKVPNDRAKVIVFDDFVAQTRSVYEEVLDFLEVPPDGRTTFPKINANKSVHSFRIQRLSVRIRNLKRTLGIQTGFGINLVEKLRQINTNAVQRPELSEHLLAELRDYFKEDVVKLSTLLGRNLSPWLAGLSVAECDRPRRSAREA